MGVTSVAGSNPAIPPKVCPDRFMGSVAQLAEHQTASAEASALFPRPEVTVGVPSLICWSRVRVPPLPSTFVGGRFMEGVAQLVERCTGFGQGFCTFSSSRGDRGGSFGYVCRGFESRRPPARTFGTCHGLCRLRVGRLWPRKRPVASAPFPQLRCLWGFLRLLRG
jgi:hypothetical protein